jgi:hypothetical protein
MHLELPQSRESMAEPCVCVWGGGRVQHATRHTIKQTARCVRAI